MRRLVRHIFTLCSTLSLLLCVAMCALWVRSYWRCDEFNIITHDQWHFDGSHYGKIAFVRERILPPGKLKPRVMFFTHDYSKSKTAPRDFRMWSPYTSFCNPLYEKFGFIVGVRPRGVKGTVTSGFVIAIPHWAIVVITAILPGIWFINVLRTRRQLRAGLCHSCGYDLRASPERCPECGKVSKVTA